MQEQPLMLGESIALIIGASYFGVEAYKVWGERPIARWILSGLCLAFLLAGAFLYPISTAVPEIGTFVSGVFDDPSSWFLLLMGLFFVLRPFWQPKPQNRKPIADQPLASDGRTLIDRFNKIDANVRGLTDSVEDFDRRVAGTSKFVSEHAQQLDAKLSKIRAGITATERKISQVSNHLDRVDNYFRQQVIWLYYAIAAIGHRERLYRLGAQIEEQAQTLCTPTDEAATFDADQWEAWKRKEEAWRDTLEQWCGLAQFYKGDLREIVFSTPAAYYKSSWSIKDEQFPNSTAVYEYKTFRILLKNWRDVEGEVHAVVYGIAFDGTAAQTRPVEGPKPLRTTNDGNP